MTKRHPPPAVVLHLKDKDCGTDLRGWHLALCRVMVDILRDSGIAVHLRPRDADIKVGTRHVADNRFDDGNLHIIDDRSVCMDNVLNCGVAYLWEFWHLDPKGVKSFSSIGDRHFDPKNISAKRAQDFVANLRKWYVDKRKSKYAQTAGYETMAEGATAVFFQGLYPLAAKTSNVSDFEMLQQICDQTGDDPIVVKPHPFATPQSDIKKLHQLASQDERLTITQANVHDILSKCALTASINSTVALEGFLHKKPAVLFGIADFHQASHTVGPAQNFAQAQDAALTKDTAYEAFLFWYFFKNCISYHGAKRDALIWAAFDAAGFPKERFLTQA